MSIVVHVWKCRSSRQSTRYKQVAEERGNVVNVERGSSSWATISKYLASDNCPWPRIALALVSNSCGFGGRHTERSARCRWPTATDARPPRRPREPRARPGHARQDRPGQVVDQFAERRVFLRRPTDDGEGPDRAGSVIDGVNVEHREIVCQAVIARDGRRTALRAGLSAGRRCR